MIYCRTVQSQLPLEEGDSVVRISFPVGGTFPWLVDARGCPVEAVEFCIPPHGSYAVDTHDLASDPNCSTTSSQRVHVFSAQNGAASRKAIAALREGEQCCWQCGCPSFPGAIIDGICPECEGRFKP